MLPYWIASLFVPGWGQLCLARTRAEGLGAFLWLAAVAAAYVSGGPLAGAIAHAACAAHARLLGQRLSR